MPRRPLCRHCRERHVNRPRGLCWRCYYAPGVRERYEPVGPEGVHLHGEAAARRNAEIRRLDARGHTLAEIAGKVGLTGERVRQILATPSDA